MKIVFVSDAIYPYNKGGKEKRLFELSTRLAALGHEVHIYTMHWWRSPHIRRSENGVQLHALSRHYNLYTGDRRSIKQGILFGLACFKLFTVQFDVLDVDHMPFFPVFSTWLVCTLRRKKLFGTWHEALSTQDWVHYMGKSGYIAALIEKMSIRLPHYITAASEQTKELLAVHHRRSRGVGVVASGVDVQVIKKVYPAKEKLDVLYVGRLVKDKNVDVLVQAIGILAARHPRIRCLIVGQGIERRALQRLVRRRKLSSHVSILGPLAHDTDVYAYMKRAKVFVLPSIREGFGIVALEAISCGTPVVTTNAPANAAKAFIVPETTGSVTTLDPAQIAEAIEYWLTADRAVKQTDYIAGYTWNSLAAKLAEVYVS